MYCKNCGKEIDADSRFCPYCGVVLNDSQPFPGGNSSSAPRPVVTYSEKSEFVAILLSFLITGLGHIYVGKSTQGIKLLVLQVLLSVLTGMAVLIDPILGLIGLANIALWFYAMYDSHKVCMEYNRSLRDTGYPPW